MRLVGANGEMIYFVFAQKCATKIFQLLSLTRGRTCPKTRRPTTKPANLKIVPSVSKGQGYVGMVQALVSQKCSSLHVCIKLGVSGIKDIVFI